MEQQDSQTGTHASFFNFTGGYLAYYGVYIVNALLSIITLGIYTAWAKVRNRRFFLGHTRLNDHSFDFTASPVRILVSRLIVAGVLIGAAFFDALIASTTVLPQGLAVISLLLLLLLPYVIVRSRAFNAKHTVYRGVGFSYERLYRPSYRLFIRIGVPAMTLLLLFTPLDLDTEPANPAANFLANDISGGWYLVAALLVFIVLYVPVWLHERTRILVEQLSLGRIRFKFTATIGQYYWYYLLPLAVISAIAASLIIAPPENPGRYIPILYLLFIYYNAVATKLLWSSISSDSGVKVQSSLNVFTYCVFLTFVNHLLLVLTAFIYLPAARVRKWKWISDSLTLVTTGDFATAATDDQFQEAFSSEFMDVGDYDFDFGL